MWVYIVCVETLCIRHNKLAKQNISQVFHRKALPTRHSRKPAVTICHDFSHSSCVLNTCFTSQEDLSQATRENFFTFQFALSLYTFSHTQPLQWNPIWNTGYKRLKKITIKFDTELKPTQNNCKSQLYSPYKSCSASPNIPKIYCSQGSHITIAIVGILPIKLLSEFLVTGSLLLYFEAKFVNHNGDCFIAA